MPYVEIYDAFRYSAVLAKIEYLVNDFLRIKSNSTSCHACLADILHQISRGLAALYGVSPSTNNTEQLQDLNRLTKISRQLLQIDPTGITTSVWLLIDAKASSLCGTRIAGASFSLLEARSEIAEDYRVQEPWDDERLCYRRAMDVEEGVPNKEHSTSQASNPDHDMMQGAIGSPSSISASPSSGVQTNGRTSSQQRSPSPEARWSIQLHGLNYSGLIL
ncbi:MAG: hypothetical protein Q9170_005292 [Blastenia crenularia]